MINFTRHQFRELDSPRELTARERSVLSALIGGTRASDQARCQIAQAHVTAECVDRCGSIALSSSVVGCGALEIESGLIGSGEHRRGEEPGQDVLLFAKDGVLDHLETYRENGEIPTGLPPVEDLTVLTPRDP